MANLKYLVYLVAVLAITLSLSFVSADFAEITSVEVNGVEGIGAGSIAAFAGETLPVRIIFQANADANDTRLKVWISGNRDYSVSTARFDVLTGRTYSRLVSVQVPFDIDPSEDLTLMVTVESRNEGLADSVEIPIGAERESYIVEPLDVDMPSKVVAGQSLPVNVVLKNRGRQEAEDTFVRARIPALGVESRAYFGDLSAVDQSDPDKEDAAERTLVLKVPSDAPAGVYVVEFDVFNGDYAATVTKRVAIVGAGEDSRVVSSSTTKTFNVGETATYTLTLVNAGDSVRVYEIEVISSNDLKVDSDEPVVAVPAGESKTVKLMASSTKAGKQSFTVNVVSDGNLVKSQTFTANVEGRGIGAGNATVVLTVVLAIIFVVLLVVLIVLLTRKPEKKEELGESYY